MTKKTVAVKGKEKATVEKAVEMAPAYTPSQWGDWFEEIGKLAGRARTNGKMFAAKQERIKQGVDKEALQAQVVALASAGKITEMLPIARELENADTLLESLNERADEYRTKYIEAMHMLSIIVNHAPKFDPITDFDPDKYMLENFPSQGQIDAETEKLKMGTMHQEALVMDREITEERAAKKQAAKETELVVINTEKQTD
jgi:hypothetical protein